MPIYIHLQYIFNTTTIPQRGSEQDDLRLLLVATFHKSPTMVQVLVSMIMWRRETACELAWRETFKVVVYFTIRKFDSVVLTIISYFKQIPFVEWAT